MGGSSTLGGKSGLAGVYGTLGEPAAGNVPGSRYAAANWIDSGGNLWLFGGYGYDANGDSGYLNDLWEFNPSTNEWTWMGGSSTVGSHGGQSGVSGALGVFAAENIPGSRYGAANWTDESGNLWLFGGYAYDANDPNFRADELNDLWEFNPFTNEWAWIAGNSAIGENYSQPGVYGALGTPAAGNTPGGRYAPSNWTDDNGNLWLFGGQGYTSNGDFYELNDLWEFSPSTNEWAWMNGSSTVGSNGDQPGVYGTLGTTDAGNTPGNRSDASSWTDSNGNLWLFGGNGYDAGGNGGYLNDLWEFSPSTNEWVWMNGSSTVGGNGGQSGVYGTLGTLADGDGPGGRSSAASWTDHGGNLWLFGGYGADASGSGGYLNDLWEFDPSADEWAWMGGSSTVGGNGGQSGVYGTLGTPAAGNIPGGRDSAISWTGSNGDLWLFGGYGYDANGNYGYLNDLWKYQPSTAAVSAALPTFLPPAGTYASAQSVAISDTTNGATIYYTTNGTTPTVSSVQYTGPIAVSSTETIRAMAAASGFSNSSAATAP
jgi:N-acetylneuraminic acid mutarotase